MRFLPYLLALLVVFVFSSGFGSAARVSVSVSVDAPGHPTHSHNRRQAHTPIAQRAVPEPVESAAPKELPSPQAAPVSSSDDSGASVMSMKVADEGQKDFFSFQSYMITPKVPKLLSTTPTAYQATLQRAQATNPLLARAARPLASASLAPMSLIYQQMAQRSAARNAAKQLAASMVGALPPMPDIPGVRGPAPAPGPAPSGGCVENPHNTDEDCWVFIQSSVYDLSSGKFKHTGGRSTITPVCGGDGEKALLDKHDQSYVAKLANFKLSQEQIAAGAFSCPPGVSPPNAGPAPSTPAPETPAEESPAPEGQ